MQSQRQISQCNYILKVSHSYNTSGTIIWKQCSNIIATYDSFGNTNNGLKKPNLFVLNRNFTSPNSHRYKYLLYHSKANIISIITDNNQTTFSGSMVRIKAPMFHQKTHVPFSKKPFLWNSNVFFASKAQKNNFRNIHSAINWTDKSTNPSNHRRNSTINSTINRIDKAQIHTIIVEVVPLNQQSTDSINTKKELYWYKH